MSKVIKVLLLMLVPSASWAIVDMRNANFSDTWNDIIVPGSGYDLRVRRTYNSRAIFNGIFGFGWCSDFETSLLVTPENIIEVTECGGGMKVSYIPKGYSHAKVKKTIDKIVREVKKRNKTLKPSYLKELRAKLERNDFLREEFNRQLKLKGKVKKGKQFFAEGRENESMTLKGGHYLRVLADGTFQKFNLKGRLTHMYDRNGNFLKLLYNKSKLIGVVDNNGRKLTIGYHSGVRKVRKITGPNGLSAVYGFNGEDLAKVTNAWKNTFRYAYDDLHNLTSIKFPDKTEKKLTYNADKDWVTSFKNRKGCVESYGYFEDKKTPENHYWSTVTKKCGSKVTNKSKYEFFHRVREDGSRYLYRSISNNNGDETDVIYHEVFGKPTSVIRNHIKVSYRYYDNGMIRIKYEPHRSTKFFYKNRCKKVSAVTSDYYANNRQTASKKRKRKKGQKTKVKKKVIRTVKSQFTYDRKKCNLVSANNTDGQKVTIDYDQRGRISEIVDQANKTVTIRYEERFGKPQFVTRPGLGTIKVSYKKNGQVDTVVSKDGPVVARQVASIFNNLLDIIAPATSEVNL